MKLETQCVSYDGFEYPVPSLITASKDFEIIDLDVEYIYQASTLAPDTSVFEFAIHMKRVMDSDLDFPIILSPINTILDGRHRLTKAIFLNKKTIKIVKFSQMPRIGFKE